MPELTIIYWRDIPAQVLAGQGRKALKRALPDRFQVAIDKAAMRGGARDGDAYLADWRRSPAGSRDGDAEAVVEAVAAEIDAAYDPERLGRLVAAGGRDA